MGEQLELFDIGNGAGSLLLKPAWMCKQPDCAQKRKRRMEWCEEHLVRDQSCQFPKSAVFTAYRLGCRCARCCAYQAQQKSPVCKVEGCTNLKMFRKQSCETHWLENQQTCRVDGCSEITRSGNLYCAKHRDGMRKHTCDVCGRVYQGRRFNRALCSECGKKYGSFVKRARQHNAPVELIRKWIANPVCELCKQRLYLASTTGGGTAGSAHIDHYHGCCNYNTSCGKCLRGLLCRECNLGLGHYESFVTRCGGTDLIGDYLKGPA